MRTFVATLVLLSALSAHRAHAEHRISFDGYGPVKIGMTPSAIEKALGVSISGDPDFDDEACRLASVTHGHEGVSFMLVDELLVRVDVDSPLVTTVSGVGIGSSESDVTHTYGNRIKRSPHAYTSPDGNYLTLLSSDRSKGVRFETLAGKVTRYYAGSAEAIQYIEGCQ